MSDECAPSPSAADLELARRSLRNAYVCGAAPLFCSASVLALSYFTRWDWLLMIGLFTIWVGFFLFILGVCYRQRFLFLTRGAQGGAARQRSQLALGALLLLLSNFPAAALWIYGAVVVVCLHR